MEATQDSHTENELNLLKIVKDIRHPHSQDVLVGKELAGREVLILALEPKNPNDKAKFVKV